MLIVSLFACNQIFNFASYLFKVLFKSDSLSASMYTQWAIKMGNKTFKTLIKSFMRNINNKGPKMLPCGTPHVINLIWDLKFLTWTNVLPFFR